MQNLKEAVLEISEIVREVPEQLQLRCFEILLQDLLDRRALAKSEESPIKAPPLPQEPPKEVGSTIETLVEPNGFSTQEDISLASLHLKAKKFLEKYSISIEQINNLFYKESDEILPLYDDLKTTKMSEAQIRVALLQALTRALTSGDFVAQVSSVRSECTDRKVLDGANFSTIFKNSAENFDFEAFGRETVEVKLSEIGRGKLAELIKSMQ
jgi:hypothetical protein